MRLIRADDQAKTAARRWRHQYYDARRKQWLHTEDAETVYRQIRALNPPTAETVNAIIGNQSWTYGWCGECADYVPIAVEFFQTGEPASLCPQCLTEAYHLMFPGLVK